MEIKVEYHANAEYENPLKHSEKNSIHWSKVNVSNNGKKYLTLLVFSLNDFYFLGFYIKNSNKTFFNQTNIAKITNSITKLQFLTIIKLTYIRIT